MPWSRRCLPFLLQTPMQSSIARRECITRVASAVPPPPPWSRQGRLARLWSRRIAASSTAGASAGNSTGGLVAGLGEPGSSGASQCAALLLKAPPSLQPVGEGLRERLHATLQRLLRQRLVDRLGNISRRRPQLGLARRAGCAPAQRRDAP